MQIKTIRTAAFLLVALFTIVSTDANAQGKPGVVKGIITDTLGNMNLASATINILDAKDSSLTTFGRTKEDGSFNISKLAVGSYVLLVSYTGFEKVEKGFSISADKPEYDFKTIPMTSSDALEDVVITATPIVVKGDTVEYNAGSFKVNKPNAVVEDLLKKLPGVEVDRDGKITANGQEVKKILVDGKEFFANDPKLASKNLQADMINKVQVFEKKSDQSQFTGFDDGNSEPTINLTLKNDKRTGIFGKVSAGGGTDSRYQANANVNQFKQGQQASFIGQANNVNQQGFSLMDALSFSGGGAGGAGGGGMRGGGGGLTVGGGGGSQGITATQAAGLNYNNFKNSKIDFTSSYFFNGTQVNNDYITRQEQNLQDSIRLYLEPGTSRRENYNHRLNLGLDWRVDSFNSIKITPSISYQNTNNFTNKTYATTGAKGNILTDGNSNTSQDSHGYNFSTTALWRHSFAKKGRTFSSDIRIGRNESDGDGTQYTLNRNATDTGFISQILDQQNTSKTVSNTFSANLSYTEPVSRRSLLEFNTWYNYNGSTNDKTTYDYNVITDEYDLVNKRLTNYFDNDYTYTGAGINYRENRKNWNYTLGAKLQHAELSSLLQGSKDAIKQSFLNVLPTAQLQISKNRYRSFRMYYNGSTTQPSISQLQPIEDISNFPNITVGNPDLKQSFTNNVRLNYNSFDPYTQKSFFANINGRQTFNSIVNSDVIDTLGRRRTTYENLQGVYNISGNVSFGFPVAFGDTKANISLNTAGSYGQNVNLLNQKENMIRNLNVTERVNINYTFKEILDLGLGGGVNWTRARYSLQESQNTNYFTYTGSFDFNIYLPLGFTLASDLYYTANTGRAKGYNNNFTLWNASLARTFLKSKKLEVRLSVNDILNQNTGISRTTENNYITDTRYTVLKRYGLITLTYNLSQFGASMGGSRGGGPGMMMMGRPGGRF